MSDGPAFVTETVAMPVPPGAMVGVDVVTPRSDDAERVGTEGVEVLLPGVGSEVEELTFKDPPVSAEFGAALEMTLIGTKTSLLPAGVSGPVMEQVIGPVGIGPMQPEGREVISTPAGGVNDMEIGAAAFDGPPFVTVRVADPVPPGTIPAVIEAVERSAWPGPTATDEATVLFVLFGSAVAVATLADPPDSVEFGGAPAGKRTEMACVALAPLAIGPATEQMIGPVGSAPAQPGASDTTSTPVGGV